MIVVRTLETSSEIIAENALELSDIPDPKP